MQMFKLQFDRATSFFNFFRILKFADREPGEDEVLQKEGEWFPNGGIATLTYDGKTYIAAASSSFLPLSEQVYQITAEDTGHNLTAPTEGFIKYGDETEGQRSDLGAAVPPSQVSLQTTTLVEEVSMAAEVGIDDSPSELDLLPEFQDERPTVIPE
jgi:hypothetical protein